MTDASLLAHIARLPHARANFKQLVRELGSKGMNRTDLQTALDRLARRGELVEFRPGHFASASHSREFASGRIHMHRDGYGFVIPERPIEGLSGDIYIPQSSAERVMHGDRVLVRLGHFGGDGRVEGEILRVLQRAHTTVVGEFHVGRRANYVAPHDDRIRQWILIPEGLEIPSTDLESDRVGVQPVRVETLQDLDGMIVNVEMLEFPDEDGDALGRIIEILGKPGDFGIDVEIVIRKHHLPHRFSAKVLREAEASPTEVTAAEIGTRTDFRGLDIVTIDGETARDFDDAVLVDMLPNGNFALQVHIADVSHYVRPGSAIDEEAELRGTSVYFPDRAVPMLPQQLSTGICSLRPQEDRLVLSALMEIDHRGDLVGVEFVRGVIRSVERMTYTSVHKVLEGDPAECERYSRLQARFERMRELALILNRKRVRRGSIDFDLPEPLIEFDEWGEMVGVIRAPRNIAHRIIEEFMLAANEAVAARLNDAGIPSIYRIHEQPNPKRVAEFEEAAVQFGYSLGVGSIPMRKFGFTARHRDGTKTRREIMTPEEVKVTSRMYQKLISQAEGKPEERILNYLLLRSLKQARYSTDNPGHFALAAPLYTHFTSPIRRYPDLIVHRLLTAVLAGEPTPAEPQLRAIAEDASSTERRAADAERELVEWKKARFMENRVGDEFPAMVISTTKYGLFVELQDLFIEGLVPIDLLPGDRYTYHENARQIVGVHTRREFSIGNRLKVRLDRVDATERKLQFSIVEEDTRRNKRRTKYRG